MSHPFGQPELLEFAELFFNVHLQRLAAEGAFEFVKLALERQPTAFRDESAMMAQATIELFLPTIDGAGFQAVSAAQLDNGCAGLPLLKDGELLFGGNATPAAAFNSWTLVHLHKVKQAFQTVQISNGAD